jgi:hypothetical protein
MRPTQSAEHGFSIAITNFSNARGALAKGDQAQGLGTIALALQQTTDGLRDLSVGVRATYILLEEVKQLLQQQRR